MNLECRFVTTGGGVEGKAVSRRTGDEKLIAVALTAELIVGALAIPAAANKKRKKKKKA